VIEMSGDPGQRPGRTGELPPGVIKTIVAKAAPPTERNRGVLTVTAGSEVGRVVSIPGGQMVTLGRSDEATVRFDDVSLSRVHARIMRVAAAHVLSDAGSTNGSYVNDKRVESPVELRDGDRVQLGSATTLRFSLVDQAEEEALRQVYEAAMRDGLTGVFNRKHLEERLDAEVTYALHHQTHLSVIMIDVDFFKRVNDTFGHLAGDAVLRQMGTTLTRGVRTEDVVARYGGEEFVVVARGIDAYNACLLADRLRWTVSQTPIVYHGQQIWVTSSAGVASLVCCGEQLDKTTLMGIADKRLYQAKEGGRNRVVGPLPFFRGVLAAADLAWTRGPPDSRRPRAAT
jgi:diguanylate cyclase (GGDEF)-like protein